MEALFAHPKRILKPDRLRLRVPSDDEFLLAATVQHPRRMAKQLYSRGPNMAVPAA